MSFYSNGTGSLSVWGRSTDFFVLLKAYDPDGILVDSFDGIDNAVWNPDPPYGDGNAAINIPLTKIGNYDIHLSSSNDPDYYGGDFKLIESPGSKLEASWSGSSPANVIHISSSNMLYIVDNNAQVAFYSLNTKNFITYSYGTTYNGAYSKSKNTAYAWVVSGGTNYVFEYNTTGSFTHSSSIQSNVSWNGFMFHDDINDRLVFLKKSFTNPQRVIIWDMASRTVIQDIDVTPSCSFVMDYGTYSQVNNSYYIQQFTSVNTLNPMIKIDANTFDVSLTSATGYSFLQYISASSKIMSYGGGISLLFIDPVLDTTIYTDPSFGGFFEDAVYDPCINCYISVVDFGGSPHVLGLNVYDHNFSASNCIVLDNSSNIFGYSACFVETGSRVYIAASDFNVNRLYSCKVSIPTGSIMV